MDFYSTLGVSKTASQDEIKKAYKKLAMKHHPDRGGSEEKLSKINEAYTVLKDPKKRQQYDYGGNTGSNGFSGRGGFSGRPDMSSIFDDIFSTNGFRGGFHTHMGNANVQMRVVLNINDCINGKEYNTEYSLRNGETKTVSIKIPPGVLSGETLRIPGGGDNSNPNAPPGDLLLGIVVKPPHNWDIHENHLLTSKDVNIFDLMIGTTIIVESPTKKKLKLKIPSGTQNDTVMQIAGEGLPNHRNKTNGNIHVKIKSFVPKIESDELMTKIKELKDEISKISV